MKMQKSVPPPAKWKMINHADGGILWFPGRQAGKASQWSWVDYKLCRLKRKLLWKQYNARGKDLCTSFMPLCLHAFLRLYGLRTKTVHWVNSFQCKALLGICILLVWSPPFVLVKACRCSVYWRRKNYFVWAALWVQSAACSVQQRVGSIIVHAV